MFALRVNPVNGMFIVVGGILDMDDVMKVLSIVKLDLASVPTDLQDEWDAIATMTDESGCEYTYLLAVKDASGCDTSDEDSVIAASLKAARRILNGRSISSAIE